MEVYFINKNKKKINILYHERTCKFNINVPLIKCFTTTHSPAVEWVYLKMFVKVFFSFDYSNIGVL